MKGRLLSLMVKILAAFGLTVSIFPLRPPETFATVIFLTTIPVKICQFLRLTANFFTGPFYG